MRHRMTALALASTAGLALIVGPDAAAVAQPGWQEARPLSIGAQDAPARAGGADRTVLFVTAHPDDETMFGLGRFVERGWDVHIVVVTNGEGGQVVQSIHDAPAQADPLQESPPGPSVQVVTTPPVGPPGRPVRTATDLARERQAELRVSMALQDVTDVTFLSDVRRSEYEDSWDRGVTRWDRPRLRRTLARQAERVDADVVVTLNPDETWAHPQHVGLGRIVRSLWRHHRLDGADGRRPALYGLREHGWYDRSLVRQRGDEAFDRLAHSPVLGMTYAEHWRLATSAYVSQSSHPVWFAARVATGILPGYAATDVIRRLGRGAGGTTLTTLLEADPPTPR